MARPPSPASRQRAVDDFNRQHAIGAPFWAHRGVRGDNPIAVTLKAPAELLGGHTPVAWLDGTSGCIALTHLEPRTHAHTEESCPGHVASGADAKVCGRCGVHIDSLRPDDDAEGGL